MYPEHSMQSSLAKKFCLEIAWLNVANMTDGDWLRLETNRSMLDGMHSLSIAGPRGSTDSDTLDQSILTHQAANADSTKPLVKNWASVAASKVKQGQTLQLRQEVPAHQQRNDAQDKAQDGSGARAAIASRHEYIIKNDWRGPGPEAHRVHATSGFDNPQRSGHDHRPGPRTLGGCLYEDLVPGTIIWHWDVRPWNADKHDPEWIAFEDDSGRPMMQKGRYFVIVEKLTSGEGEFNVLEAAIYTNDDTGLEHIDAEKHHHYFSLCPSHIHVTRFENLSPSNPVLTINLMRQKRGKESKLDRKTMVVNWARLRKNNINIVDIRIVGTLDNASRDALCAKALTTQRSK